MPRGSHTVSAHAAATDTAFNRELPSDLLLTAYRAMLTARRIDEKHLILLKQGKSFFHIGGSGHEAIQLAAALNLKPGFDWSMPYYRDLAFSLGMGFTPTDYFLAAFGRVSCPATGGRQMPGHYGRNDLRIITQSSPTGTQYLQAVGAALAVKKEHAEEVVYVSSGEGATSEGEFFEAINWASREAAPVLFVIQDNTYAISVPVAQQTAGGSILDAMSGVSGLHLESVDGTSFIDSFEVMQRAVARARRGEGPSLIHASVVRLLPHSSSDDQAKYRSKEALERDRMRDPIPALRSELLSRNILTQEEADRIVEEVRAAVDAAAETAEKDRYPDAATVADNVYGTAHANPPRTFREPEHAGSRVVLVDAVNHTLHEELEHDPRVVVFGEDVEDGKGGVFTATKGLSTKFGRERVFNSPLAEASIVGVAIGMALKGWKPVVEIQFGDYIWPAFMQIRDELSMMRYRSDNHWTAPLVIRTPVGGFIHGGHYHSQCIEAFFAHIPGIRLAFPSNAADAKGLLRSAIRGDDPVLFMEHKGLYRQGYAASPEPAADYLLPFGLAAVRREGTDVSVITYGAMVQQSLEAARMLEERGISVEVIDLRTLNPLDTETILASVRKTNRVLVVHEDTLTAGFGAEIAAMIAERAFRDLDAPVMRLGALDTPVPFAPPLEDAMLPNKLKILAALEQLAGY